jgi:hypothetical protein
MTCLAAVASNLSGFIESAKAADKNIVIEKKKTEISPEIIDRVTGEIRKAMNA